jgi:hypothetical protein
MFYGSPFAILMLEKSDRLRVFIQHNPAPLKGGLLENYR